MTTESQKRYVEKHRDRVLASKRKWNSGPNGREVRRAWQRSDEGKAWYRAELKRTRALILDGYGGKCECCGEKERNFLSIDHVNGGGGQERKRIGSGSAFHAKIIKANFPPEYRILCHNCNFSNGIYGFCPHKTAVPICEAVDNPASP